MLRGCRCVAALAAALLAASLSRTAGQMPLATQMPEAAAEVAAGFDPLWLRYPLVSEGQLLAGYRSLLGASAAVICTAGAPCGDAISRSQLSAAAAELQSGLRGLLGTAFTATVTAKPAAGTNLTASVLGGAASAALGKEGFRIRQDPSSKTVHIEAATSSGLLYGTFKLLSLIQQHKAIPQDYESAPAMEFRVWDLWDNVDGSIEQGFSGRSILWPYALLDDDRPPPRNKIFLRECNASDSWQQWRVAPTPGNRSSIVNVASDECLSSEAPQNPMETTASASSCTGWSFNANGTISAWSRDAVQPHGAPWSLGRCIDVQFGEGPVVQLTSCTHPPTSRDPVELAHIRKQMFSYDHVTRQIKTMPEIHSVDGGQCLSVERIRPAEPGLDPLDRDGPGAYRTRFAHMLRSIKSAGYNGLAILNVNACEGENLMTLESESLKNISKNVGQLFLEYGITPYWTVCYAAPVMLANISSNPDNPAAEAWWAAKAAEIKSLFPTFGGVLVKADCEGNAGPQSFNKTEADGANMLARALKPIEDTVVMWRAFIYGGDTSNAHEEKAKQEYDTIHPQDGLFEDNVIVQIKHTPMDFLIRDPLHPLLAGGLTKTNMMMEAYTGGCDTGQQIHAVALTPQWKHYLDFDLDLNGTTIASMLSGKHHQYKGRGMACISNFGRWRNVTGHVFAASSAFGCGRLAWDPTQDPSEIHREWTAMTFSSPVVSTAGRSKVIDTVVSILDQSWTTYEGYTSALGVGWMCASCGSYALDDAPGSGFGCAPKTAGPGPGPDGAQCPFSRQCNYDCLQSTPEFPYFGHPGGFDDGHQNWHYFVDPCANYDTQNMSAYGLGCNRVSTGTDFASRYLAPVAKMYNNISTCPQELLLFFHNLAWTHPIALANGSTAPLIDYISVRSQEARDEAEQHAHDWNSLLGFVDNVRFAAVQARFKQQNVDALAFSQVIVGYYRNISTS